MQKNIEKANIICEALPYIAKLRGKTVVIKYGGNAMQNEEIISTIMQDISILKIVGVNPILVYGGGPEINNMLSKLKIESAFHKGLRITDKDTMEVVQMVMCGKINKDIVTRLNNLKVQAIGISGKDADLIRVTKSVSSDGVDLGYVGDIQSINSAMLHTLCEDGFLPVIAGIGADGKGDSYNINADTVASDIASTLNAEKLLFLTDIDGIRRNAEDPSSLISEINVSEIKELIANGTISGGMLPKVNACTYAIEKGVKNVHIINGTTRHPILLEIFTDKGIGTLIKN